MRYRLETKKTPVTLLAAAIGLALQVAAASALAQQPPEQPPATGPTTDATELDTIQVVGYRASLVRALDLKRDSVGSIDAIVAEDIADFPDQNLAESLQRIPGITITRDSGEGRNISVRGLSGEFTRVRVNGMEAIAATGGEGGPNRGRDFDYNVFASELFNSIVVHKTASASLDEGSLGAVVDLNTGNPFGYEHGRTFVVSGEGQYNDLTEDAGPRVAALFAYRDPGDVWGVSFSAAYSDNTTKELGQNTVRWQQAGFRSVGGVVCADNPDDAGCSEVADAFHARIPRYGEIEVERERLGLTGSFELRPTDSTRLRVDVLHSKLDAARREKWLEVLFRGNEGGMDVTDYTIDPATNTLTRMEVDNAWVRSENFEKAWTTEFTQWSTSLEQSFTDTLSGSLSMGRSTSTLEFPHEITYMYDDRDYNGFVYDYTDDRRPVIAYNGADVTDPANFQMAEFRDRPSRTEHTFDTISAEVEWAFSPNYWLQAGATHRKFTFETWGGIRDSGVCAAGLYDCDPDGDGIADFYGIPATGNLSEIHEFDDATGSGSTTRWVVPNLAAWNDFIDLFGRPMREDQGNVRQVQEEDTAYFVQLNGATELAGRDFRFDLGVRYVETDQSSSGYNSGVYVYVDRPTYSDTLPSANFAWSLTPDLIWRMSAAKVMTRPSLGNLTPGGSVDSFNYRVSFQNPFLDPTRATAFDTALEWYFAPESILSLALFYKDIDSRPIRAERTGTYASTGLPLSLLVPTSPAEQDPEGRPWTISTIDNGPGGKLKGFEVGFQMPLSLFAEGVPVLRNMGMIGNYTWVDSEVDYTFGSEIVTERLFGLSKNSYNFTLFYENDRFDARVSAAYRSDYLDGTSGTGNRFEGYDGTLNVDASLGYKINERFEVTLEGLNLTDDYQDRWTDIDARRRYEWDHTGRVYKLGFRYRF
ncbi:TonB-dependent receptor [Luteimonas sp. SJ-92]|uniref:TonB-dependent receptor n=1 Tax=Luteimonas salinisoli TaxID=2752307 RepID=A0A853JAY5_9GAMM|nr:TonB-dependent receptor [Luteimonas salinisoli]NZA25798.1 TonB-dependent receptor [Luteimonas salinisoli]